MHDHRENGVVPRRHPYVAVAIAHRVCPNVLLLFASWLVRSDRSRRRRQVTTAAPIRHRLELLRLCLERAWRNGEV